MATKTKKKNGGKKNKNKNKNGGGEKFDVAKSMIKSEKLYDQLMSESIKYLNSNDEWNTDDTSDTITTEYIVTARRAPGSASSAASDWIPVAQLCVTRPIQYGEDDHDDGSVHPSVRAAISLYRREIIHAGTLAAPAALGSVPRNLVEYGAEPTESFVRYVYEDVIEGKKESFVDATGDDGDGEDGKVRMTKMKAREILGLDAGERDATIIKRAYRERSMELHPDRFAMSGATRTQEEIDEASVRFGLAKMAYDALNSGVRSSSSDGDSTSSTSASSRSSWYESLGGRSRTEFHGPLELMNAEASSEFFARGVKSAVVGLDPDLTMAFVARNQDAAR